MIATGILLAFYYEASPARASASVRSISEEAAFASMGAILVVMTLWPFLDGWLRRRWPGSEASVYLGIVAMLAILGLTVWEALAAH